MYERTLVEVLQKKVGSGKAIILIGPRQVGKTTLIKSKLIHGSHLFLDADDPTVRSLLDQPNTEQLKSIIGKHKVIFIDEAQRIPGIGLTLKILVDQFDGIQLFVSGSSSFDLTNQLSEPLTGRKWEFEMFPISWEEYENKHGYLVSEQQLENRLIYGFYPDVLNNPGEEKEVLKQLVDSYLYRDILAYSKIGKPEVLDRLVQALALQMGNEVNYNELAQTVGVDRNTISNYIDILQKGYVVFKLGSFSGNLRNEIKKNKKIYFYDNGVRNTVLGNFATLNLRQDTGALWENFLISERIKQNHYKRTFAKTYFWRTKQQQEVDFIEEMDGKITGFEFKWKAKKGTTLPKTFVEKYKAEQRIIDRDNFRDFVVI
ncbi:ATP-binding protein [Flexithrix dorotheae]|uniref:ATP-binding protein n=1 Tax=Flexithrix dorotheae TaxID=70993 RepID=UPI00037FD532|nr:ATP-binding protein [Flexithrix dorotheae]